MGMGLKDSMHTYSQFVDMVFEYIPPDAEGGESYLLLIRDQGKMVFCLFVDDHNTVGEIFKDLFDMLHQEYFPCLAFGPIYLNPRKVKAFTTNLEAVGFKGSPDGI